MEILKNTEEDRDESFFGPKIFSSVSSPRTNSQSPSSGVKDLGCMQSDMCKAFDHTSKTARGALLEAIKSQRSMVATKSCPLSKVSSFQLSTYTNVAFPHIPLINIE